MTILVFPGWAAPVPDKPFNAALSAFSDANYERAEREFGQYAVDFPASPRIPEAILYQAQARLKLTNYAGALQLLSTNLTGVGAWTDQCLFWMGETYLKQTNLPAALAAFGRVVKEFPSSPRWVEAGIEEARTLFLQGDVKAVVSLLQATNGFFQVSLKGGAANEQIFRGLLLLSEAQLIEKNYSAAETALQPLAKLSLAPAIAWQRQYLLCRIYFERGQSAEALLASSNLLSLAASTGQRDLEAESSSFRGMVLEKLGRLDEAILAYTNNLAAGLTPERQQRALSKVTEIFLLQQKPAEAATLLEQFLVLHPDTPPADLAYLNLGELRLRDYAQKKEAHPEATGSLATNLISAHSAFDNLLKRFPQSEWRGKAHLNLGWCFWFEENLAAAKMEFQAAAAALPASYEKAVALFKQADAQFRLNDFAGATTNYNLLLRQFATLEEVKTNLVEPAYYQCVRAALAAGDLPSATNAMAKIVSDFPNGFYTGRAVLLAGQQLSRLSNPGEAREILTNFVHQVPQTPLLPEVQLAIARTYEQQNAWTNAIEQYDGWLKAFTNHPGRAYAEYHRADGYKESNNKEMAVSGFTNFIAHFPTNEFTPVAQWWVADYYYNSGQLKEAESNYQLLFQLWPNTDMAYQAQMMAGRVAVARQGLKDACSYFTNLYKEASCPASLKVEAMFGYGSALMSMDSTDPNHLANYETALGVFSSIADLNPTNRYGMLAWGEKANCLMQYALYTHQYETLTNAANAYERVLTHSLADPVQVAQDSPGHTLLGMDHFAAELMQTGLHGPVVEHVLHRSAALLVP